MDEDGKIGRIADAALDPQAETAPPFDAWANVGRPFLPDPFAVFQEWSSETDKRCYRDL
jgi:hypothetical protein